MSSAQFNVVHDALVRVTGKPSSGRFKCPYHNGTGYNLSIRDTTNRVQLTCFSHSCDPKFILESLGLSLRDIYYNKPYKRKEQPTNSYQTKQSIQPYQSTQVLKSGLLTPEQFADELSEINFFKLLIDNDKLKVYPEDYARRRIAGNRLAEHFSTKWGIK